MTKTVLTSAYQVRSFCIKNELYTNGDNEAYNNLLYNIVDCCKSQTDEMLFEIAKDIYIHSNRTKMQEHGMYEITDIINKMIFEHTITISYDMENSDYN